MSDNQATYRQKSGGAWKVSAALGLVGLVGSLYFWSQGADRFAYSYFFGFFTCLSIALGAMFFVLIQHMTKAHWGLTTRRTGEFFMSGFPVMAVLFIPIVMFMYGGQLYAEWAQFGHHGDHGDHGAEAGHAEDGEDGHGHGHGDEAHGGDAHGGDHGSHEGGVAHTPYETDLHHRVLEHKHGYLSQHFWVVRAIFYFFIWLLISLLYFRWSVRQDDESDRATVISISRKMQTYSAASLAGFGLTLTFASFDWVMSMQAAWYSTIYGVCMFASSVVAIFAMVIFVHLRLRQKGDLGDEVNVEHFHDLGKLMFGFTCFWAYVNFSQYILIWYAGIPEEALYYQLRGGESGWGSVGIFLMVGFFVVPFLTMISRVPKRRLELLQMGAMWMLGMHVVNMYWLIVPNAGDDAGQGILSDISALLLCGGAYFTYVFIQFERYALIPKGDPRLSRCLTHVQTQ